MKTGRHVALYALIAVAGSGVLFCGCVDFLANQTASLGGDTAGGRGTVRVLFINNTPHRAVFTYGTYDQTDPSFVPEFSQFSLDGGTTLDAGQTSSIAPANDAASLECARVFSIGSAELLRLIRNNVPQDQLVDTNDEAMLEGAEFFDIPDEDDDAGQDEDAEGAADDDGESEDTTEPTSQGFAMPFEALLGVDFPCNSLLIIRFEIDDADADGPFRVDFELIPSESDR